MLKYFATAVLLSASQAVKLETSQCCNTAMTSCRGGQKDADHVPEPTFAAEVMAFESSETPEVPKSSIIPDVSETRTTEEVVEIVVHEIIPEVIEEIVHETSRGTDEPEEVVEEMIIAEIEAEIPEVEPELAEMSEEEMEEEITEVIENMLMTEELYWYEQATLMNE